MNAKRLYGVVAACAIVVYVGALWNRWAFDDLPIVAGNALVHSPDGWWRAFVTPYWPPEFGNHLYRPLTIATYAVDWWSGGPLWFHAVNIVWHVLASVLVAALVRRWVNGTAALVAGVAFAVHPVHVEAVANVVGRAELLAASFTLLALYAALVRDNVWWSSACWLLALLSKENAIVLPALILLGWAIGVAGPTPPARRRMVAFALGWLVVGAAYFLARETVLHRFQSWVVIAPAFMGQSATGERLTAVGAWPDVARLLWFPAKLRADYSPNERTAVTTPFDVRFLGGLACAFAWIAFAVVAWRRGRKVEAFGLAWVPLAYVPVSNLIFPTGILIAERTLYLPSVGLALALGGLARTLSRRAALWVAGALFVIGGAWTAQRVPVWRDNAAATLSVLVDSPRSYVGPMIMASIYLEQHKADKALPAARAALDIFALDAHPYVVAAHAALALDEPRVADSILARLESFCRSCEHDYRVQAAVAERLGDTAARDTLLARARRSAARVNGADP